MARLEVRPRDTPEERHHRPVAIDVDEDLSVHAQIIEDWTTPRQNWDFYLREGHDFGRPNNVEGHVAFVAGEQTSTLTFRLDQLDAAEDFGEELILRFEESATASPRPRGSRPRASRSSSSTSSPSPRRRRAAYSSVSIWARCSFPE
jgi:hypothetical protein